MGLKIIEGPLPKFKYTIGSYIKYADSSGGNLYVVHSLKYGPRDYRYYLLKDKYGDVQAYDAKTVEKYSILSLTNLFKKL